MSNSKSKSYNIQQRINEIIEAWTKHAPEAKFAGMTLADFQIAINPALAIRQGMSEARRELKGRVAQKTTIDEAARDLLRRVVAGVIADANYGVNSPLYRAMDYVTLNERKTGLIRRPADTTEPAATAPQTVAATASDAKA
jgi:hypothetical protein